MNFKLSRRTLLQARKKKIRREIRQHARRCYQAGMVEKARVWLKRIRDW